MPQRLSVHQIPSEKVQGEGSWLKMLRITVEEYDQHNERMAAVRKSQIDGNQAETDRLEAETRQFYVTKLLDWNWVDDAGQELPKPHKNLAALKALTIDELEFITTAILLGGGEKKVTMPYTTKL